MSVSNLQTGPDHWFDDAERLLQEARAADNRGDAPPRIPGYESLRPLSRGGQGVVYRALQSRTARAVAIKVLSEANESSLETRRRFRREIDLIARLEHPGIVRVLDSGVADDGRAYLVMEYLEGRSLAQLLSAPRASADAERQDAAGAHPATWPVRHTMEMIAAIGDAVHFAHQRGMIHRDLKPGNILVVDEGSSAVGSQPSAGEEVGSEHSSPSRQPTAESRKPLPKVLDFGLARPLVDVPPSITATTGGRFLGSLPWASPEQVQGRIDDLSVATDIYSLGVIAYQMLTGEFPYAVDAPLQQVIENITTVEPLPPSRLRPELNADVDAIVLRCLRKDPSRRYPSVAALVDDIRRALAGEPIDARREQSWRRMQARLRTARRGLIAATAAAIVLAGLAYGAITMQRRAVRAETLATQRLVESRRAGARAETVLQFLRNATVGMNPANPGVSVTSSHDMMRSMADRAMTDLRAQPEAQAEALLMIGRGQYNLGDYARAEATLAHAERLCSVLLARGEDGRSIDSATLLRWRRGALLDLGLTAHARDNLDEAKQFFRRTLELHATIPRGVPRRGPCGVAVSPHDRFTVTAMLHLGIALAADGEQDEAHELLRAAADKARSFGEGLCNHELALALFRLGDLARHGGRFNEAHRHLSEAERRLSSSFGPHSLQLADALVTKATVHYRLRECLLAEVCAREALEIYTDRLGDSHSRTAIAMIALAEALFGQDVNDRQADELLATALTHQRAQLGETHPGTAFALERLGTLWKARGDCARAVPLYEESLGILRAAPNADPVAVATAQARLGCCLCRLDGKNDDDAVSLTREALAILESRLPPGDSRLQEIRDCLAETRRVDG